MIGWSAAEFRDATIRDLADAMDGWREQNGMKPAGSGGISRDRLDELKQQYG